MQRIYRLLHPYKHSVHFMGTQSKSVDPDQTPHEAMFVLDLHRLLTECTIKIWKKEKYNQTPLKLEMGSSY